MIAKFVTAIVSVFTGLTEGFANGFVSGADTLLVDSAGELTTFASFGIIMLGCGLVFGIVRWIARKVGKI